LKCMFDTAAVVRKIKRVQTLEGDEKGEMSMGTIAAIAVISALIIMSLIIAFIVFSHRRSSPAKRARMVSRMNGVKVLPEQVIERKVDFCMVSGVCNFPQ
jgi:hypothetical protein